MFADLNEVRSGATLDTGICIMGGGAAGITLARELARANVDVLVLESGGLEPDTATLQLNDGRVIGERYPPLDTARLRYFGGTTNHWGGHCRPFDAIDFEKRAWVPYSGWPITRDELEPFYARANEVCELGLYEYDADAWVPGLHPLFDLDRAKWEHRLWHYGPPTRFGERYRDELARAPRVTVMLNANVVEVALNNTASAVTGFKLKTLGGVEAEVRAKAFVLAGGGIENPRLMLASNAVMTAGVGNAHGVVGRFFMEHPEPLIGYGIPSAGFERHSAYYHGTRATIERGSATLRIFLGPTEEMQRRLRLRNGTIGTGFGFHRAQGMLALRQARIAMQAHNIDRLGDALVTMVQDLDGLADGLLHRIRGRDVAWFRCGIEPEPNPNSRVTLDRQRDALGSPRAVLDWRLTAGDKADTRTMMRLLAEELARANVMRVNIDDWLLDKGREWQDMEVQYHHIGTTRMSDSPRTGVVDRDCKVHGIGNLYVAGSSVFATAGYANPTMTIVALALRLADHIVGEAAAGRGAWGNET